MRNNAPAGIWEGKEKIPRRPKQLESMSRKGLRICCEIIYIVEWAPGVSNDVLSAGFRLLLLICSRVRAPTTWHDTRSTAKVCGETRMKRIHFRESFSLHNGSHLIDIRRGGHRFNEKLNGWWVTVWIAWPNSNSQSRFAPINKWLGQDQPIFATVGKSFCLHSENAARCLCILV